MVHGLARSCLPVTRSYQTTRAASGPGLSGARAGRVLRPERIAAARSKHRRAFIRFSDQYPREDSSADWSTRRRYGQCRRHNWTDLSLRAGGSQSWGEWKRRRGPDWRVRSGAGIRAVVVADASPEHRRGSIARGGIGRIISVEPRAGSGTTGLD